MGGMHIPGPQRTARLALAALCLAGTGCTTLQWVSNYDETMDGEAQALQKKLDGFFVSLQAASDEQLRYKNQQAFYISAVTDLDAMDARAAGLYRNTQTQAQLKLVRQNLAWLVLLNKGCVNAPLTATQTAAVAQSGIDLGPDCQISYGASADLKDRSNTELNRYVIAPLQAQFNIELGAVMALELAKKRGQ